MKRRPSHDRWRPSWNIGIEMLRRILMARRIFDGWRSCRRHRESLRIACSARRDDYLMRRRKMQQAGACRRSGDWTIERPAGDAEPRTQDASAVARRMHHSGDPGSLPARDSLDGTSRAVIDPELPAGRRFAAIVRRRPRAGDPGGDWEGTMMRNIFAGPDAPVLFGSEGPRRGSADAEVPRPRRTGRVKEETP